jgi:hypothetical protein
MNEGALLRPAMTQQRARHGVRAFPFGKRLDPVDDNRAVPARTLHATPGVIKLAILGQFFWRGMSQLLFLSLAVSALPPPGQT